MDILNIYAISKVKMKNDKLLDLAVSGSEEEDENEFYDALAEGGSTPSIQSDRRFTLDIPKSGAGSGAGGSDSSSETDDAQEIQQVVVVTSTVEGVRDANDTRTGIAEAGGDVEDYQKQGSGDGSVTSTVNEESANGSLVKLPPTTTKRQRRTRVPDKPNYPLNLWSIMKNCIGKDLSKIPMPVNFSEPLSMLQRLTEDFEYAELLDAAAKCDNVYEQCALVAVFTISSYSTTTCRTAKPFNPLLGETYECDRTDDLGWKAISEQVSHHPPIVAQFCEGRGWKCWQEFTMTSKFRGKYLQVIPLGMAHVEFNSSGNKYSWRKVTTTVHNIIVGKLWVDQHGDMDIMGRGRAAGVNCRLKYIPYSYFSKESQRRVKGAVMDDKGVVRYIVNGTWDEKVEIAPVVGTGAVSGRIEHSRNSSLNAKTSAASLETIYQTGKPQLAWKRREPPPESERYYNFTLLAAQLNEPEPGVAPTDSRMRPDQRLMEEGNWNEANKEKLRLEEKQRASRRQREAEAEKAAAEGRPYPPYMPLWFEQRRDPEVDTIYHMYKDTYWQCKAKQDWSMCPDIF
ncbi:oxysterol-binding protein 1 isoform X2 [Agrilus planipennis]|uniref:Oxysterol-binding protein 1 isoform X2 n=1 Tax=Agrilus planipennis TaxID=224129 RepID=A0A7F5QYL7_AGRPL|nr:oxysterol-binding protein 1 isoform X2 [Agrilus planipennis]